jgi:hypothetical protein
MSTQENAHLESEPWANLPPQVGSVLAPGIPRLSDEIIEAIRAGVPAYARPLEGAFGAGVRAGVEQALIRFVELVEQPDQDHSMGRDLYVRIGRGEARAGRTMEALLAAYRIGARVAWRQVAETARAAALGEEVLARLAESIFAYIDELSAASAEGHALEQAATAGEAQRRRRRLALLLIQSPAPDRSLVEEAASDAGWQLPGSVAVLVWRPPERRIGGRLPAETLHVPLEDAGYALIPDPSPGRRREIEAALDGHPAVIGPAVSWHRAATSARRALAAHALLDEGLVSQTGLVDADDQLAALLLHADRGLLADLAHRRLAPLADETEVSRRRLGETLLAWLDHQGRVPEIAAALHVHPQTVRYRVGRLRECFGSVLDDPEARFELALALRARNPSHR